MKAQAIRFPITEKTATMTEFFVKYRKIDSQRLPPIGIVVKSELARPETQIIENYIFGFEGTAQHPQKRVEHDQ